MSAAASFATRLKALVADPNPILIKELRSIFRTKLFIRFLYLATGLLALVVLTGGTMAAVADVPPADVGQLVFQVFFTGALLVICIVAPAHGATGLTGEKQGRTYESLILTGMDPARIVTGKFLASFSSNLLVLVAFAPIVGIAFLFGGISPVEVLVGFYGLVLVLAVAISFGLALSSRLSSTVVSILFALVIFDFVAFFQTIALFGMGEGAKHAWGLSMTGPFWFTQALANRFFEPDTFFLLGVLPLYATAVTVWFFLATAIAGVRPAAEDRSTPFKLWSLFSLAGLVGIVAGVTGLLDMSDMDDEGLALPIFACVCLTFYALLFANEPPLPPRLWEQRVSEKGLLGRLMRFIGPGAAPTTRFAVGLVILGSFAVASASIVARHVKFPAHHDNFELDLAMLVLAVGTAAVTFWITTLAVWLRVVLRSGIASRVLAVAALLAVAILPLMISVIIDPGAMDDLDDEMPFLVRLSPLAPLILAVNVGDQGEIHRAIEVVIPCVIYGLLGFFFWGMIEARVRQVRKRDEERRARREEAARTSMPPSERASISDALERLSRPSQRPPPEDDGAPAEPSPSLPPLPKALRPKAEVWAEGPGMGPAESLRETMPEADDAEGGDGAAPPEAGDGDSPEEPR